MRSFRVEFDEFFEDGIISMVEVGLGPCGELRCPSCPVKHEWRYPGIGEFQVIVSTIWISTLALFESDKFCIIWLVAYLTYWGTQWFDMKLLLQELWFVLFVGNLKENLHLEPDSPILFLNPKCEKWFLNHCYADIFLCCYTYVLLLLYASVPSHFHAPGNLAYIFPPSLVYFLEGKRPINRKLWLAGLSRDLFRRAILVCSSVFIYPACVK